MKIKLLKKFTRKIKVSVFVISSVFLCMTLWFCGSFLIQKKIVPMVLKQIESKMGVKVFVKHIGVSFPFTLHFEQVVLDSKPQKSLHYSGGIDAVEIQVSFFDLFRNRLFIRNTTLVKPMFKIQFDKNELSNHQNKTISLKQRLEEVMKSIPFQSVDTVFRIEKGTFKILETSKHVSVDLVVHDLSLNAYYIKQKELSLVIQHSMAVSEVGLETKILFQHKNSQWSFSGMTSARDLFLPKWKKPISLQILAKAGSALGNAFSGEVLVNNIRVVKCNGRVLESSDKLQGVLNMNWTMRDIQSALGFSPFASFPFQMMEEWNGIIHFVLGFHKQKVDLHAIIENKQKNVALSLKGYSDFLGNRVFLDGQGTIKSFSSIHPALQMKGKMKIPFLLNSLGRSLFECKGKVVFYDCSFSNSQGVIRGLNGHIPFQERFRWKKTGQLIFAHIYKDNPFNRADFDSFQPYAVTTDSAFFHIDRVMMQQWQVGPLQAKMGIEQNVLKVNQLQVRAFNGDLAGQAYINMAKGFETIGVLGIFTQMDPTSWLPRTIDQKSKKRISGQFDMHYRVESASIEGRLDINEIGKEQLLDLIHVLDPNWENSNLVTLRKALTLAYPEYVGLSMERGFLNLVVHMPALELFKKQGKISFQGLWLAPLVSRYSHKLKRILFHYSIGGSQDE